MFEKCFEQHSYVLILKVNMLWSGARGIYRSLTYLSYWQLFCLWSLGGMHIGSCIVCGSQGGMHIGSCFVCGSQDGTHIGNCFVCGSQDGTHTGNCFVCGSQDGMLIRCSSELIR